MAFLGPNDMLVLEKATGKVQRVVNGVVQSTVLDLPVDSASERGLLGIALHPHFFTLNDDGMTPTSNPFFSAGASIGGEVGANIQKIFAYALRNSFGIAFDPVSGALWSRRTGTTASASSTAPIRASTPAGSRSWAARAHRAVQGDQDDGDAVAAGPVRRHLLRASGDPLVAHLDRGQPS